MTGALLFAVARRLLRDHTFTSMVSPAIADLQFEARQGAWPSSGRGAARRPWCRGIGVGAGGDGPAARPSDRAQAAPGGGRVMTAPAMVFEEVSKS